MRLEREETDREAVAHVNASMATSPGLAKALLALLEKVGNDPTKIDSIREAAVEALESAQDELPAVPKSDVKSDGQEITLKDNSQAIEIHVSVQGEIIRAVLSGASFNTSRSNQKVYACRLGGRLATREENRAVVTALLEKEDKGNLNQAEAKLLETYRKNVVRDLQGGLGIYDRRVDGYSNSDSGESPCYGALVVLPLVESR